jgi:hypothetical protein
MLASAKLVDVPVTETGPVPIAEAFPNAKLGDIDVMSKIMPTAELKLHAERLGYDDQQIKKLLD